MDGHEKVAEASPPVASTRRPKSMVREYAEAFGIAILLALVIRTLVVQAFTIPSGSMMDTLLVGDYILVNKFLYGPPIPGSNWHMPGIREPRRGDIVVFRFPQDEKRDFIKRVIGTPGDEVQIKGRTVYVNGRPLTEPYVKEIPSSLPRGDDAGYCGFNFGCTPLIVPTDAYFVMGDNRDNSQDSRYWGFVTREKVKGKAFLIYWSWNSDRHWLRWRRLAHWIP